MRTRQRLPGGYSLLSLRKPTTLLEPEYAALRTTIVMVADQTFGRPTRSLWNTTFTPEFLGALTRFVVFCDAEENVVGWSGYRAHTIGRDRVVYFTSTGLLPRCQGSGVIPAVQQRIVAYEARHHPFRRAVTCVRTRDPYSYLLAGYTFGKGPLCPALDGRIPEPDQPLVAGIGAWLELDVDPATAVVRGASDDRESAPDDTEPRSGDPAVDALFASLAPDDTRLVFGRRSRRSALALTFSSRSFDPASSGLSALGA